MQVLIHNPAFPKDRKKAKALTKEQFDTVSPYIIDQLNARKKLSEAVVLKMLSDAGLPLVFNEVQS